MCSFVFLLMSVKISQPAFLMNPDLIENLSISHDEQVIGYKIREILAKRSI